MEELSLNILDITMNAISADADRIVVTLREDLRKGVLEIIIDDNGRGMDKILLKKVSEPFFPIGGQEDGGMGIPLFRREALACEGEFDITSRKGQGTTVIGTFCLAHENRKPLGDMAGTMAALIRGSRGIRFVLRVSVDEKNFVFDTKEMAGWLGDMPLHHYEASAWMERYISGNMKDLGFVD